MQSKLTSWLSSIESTANLKELEEIKTQLLGKTGEISTALKGLGSLDPEIRKIQGAPAYTPYERDSHILSPTGFYICTRS